MVTGGNDDEGSCCKVTSDFSVVCLEELRKTSVCTVFPTEIRTSNIMNISQKIHRLTKAFLQKGSASGII
jgi:hypothetical protein